MRIKILASGRLKPSDPLAALIYSYTKQMKWSVSFVEYTPKHPEKDVLKLLDTHLPKDGYLIVLDEQGQNLSSPSFADLLDTIRTTHTLNLCILIGAADGIPKVVKDKAHKIISFGACTWPHMLVRLLVTEQLYRAQQILSGHPYHRE